MQRCTKLTSTKCPSGLTRSHSFPKSAWTFSLLTNRLNALPGGNSGEVTPVPMPNTEVKLSSANGTAGEALWESRSLPGALLKGPISYEMGPFFFCFWRLLQEIPRSVKLGRISTASRCCRLLLEAGVGWV